MNSFEINILQILLPNSSNLPKMHSSEDLYNSKVINENTYATLKTACQVNEVGLLSQQEVFSLVDRYKLEITQLFQQKKLLDSQSSFSQWLHQNKALYIGNYCVIKKIGQGGFGKVFLAKDLDLGTKVAIKILGQDQSTARFQREMQIYEGLDHRNIVDIYNCGVYKDSPYIVMEYADGILLRDWWRQQRELLPVIECICKIANALHYAHENGVIHRDIKPSNIMVMKNNEPKILDFGIGKLLEGQEYTNTGEILGTPMYASPEVLKGEKITYHTDIYSLGVVLYEIFTNKKPFSEGSCFAIIHQVINNDPIPPSQHCKNLPIELEKACLKAMEKIPENRYPSAFAFAKHLRKTVGLPTSDDFRNTYYETIIQQDIAPSERSKPTKYSPFKKHTNKVLLAAGVVTLLVCSYFFVSQPLEVYKATILINGAKVDDVSTVQPTDRIEIKKTQHYTYVIPLREKKWQLSHNLAKNIDTNSILIQNISDKNLLIFNANRELNRNELDSLTTDKNRAFKQKSNKPQIRIFQVTPQKMIVFRHRIFVENNHPFDVQVLVKKQLQSTYEKLSLQTVVNEGDEARIHVKANDPRQHLAIFLHDPQGTVAVIFPRNEKVRTQAFSTYSQHEFLQLPQQGSYEFDSNIGIEKIYCFYQETAIDLQQVSLYLQTLDKPLERGMHIKEKPFVYPPLQFLITHE